MEKVSLALKKKVYIGGSFFGGGGRMFSEGVFVFRDHVPKEEATHLP